MIPDPIIFCLTFKMTHNVTHLFIKQARKKMIKFSYILRYLDPFSTILPYYLHPFSTLIEVEVGWTKGGQRVDKGWRTLSVYGVFRRVFTFFYGEGRVVIEERFLGVWSWLCEPGNMQGQASTGPCV